MKLAEAMSKRYDVCKEIAELNYEYEICALSPPDKTPIKDAAQILDSMQAKYDELAELESQISCTNKKYGIDSLIVKRDQQKRQYRLLNIGYRAAFDKKIFNMDKFRVYKDLNLLRDKMHDALAQYRQYELSIQKLNHSTDLI
jgi:hypothetical protein